MNVVNGIILKMVNNNNHMVRIYVPDSFEIARCYVPSLSYSRFLTWKYDGYLPLAVHNVFESFYSIASIGRDLSYIIDNACRIVPKVSLEKIVIDIYCIDSLTGSKMIYGSYALYLPIRAREYFDIIIRSLYQSINKSLKYMDKKPIIKPCDLYRLLNELTSKDTYEIDIWTINKQYKIVGYKMSNVTEGWILVPNRIYVLMLDEVDLNDLVPIRVEPHENVLYSGWIINTPPIHVKYNGHIFAIVRGGKEPLIIEKKAPILYMTFIKDENFSTLNQH